jgi:hypothetical protein
MDAVIAAYRRDVDVTLLRSRLRLTPEQRLRDVMRMQVAVEAMRGAASASQHRPRHD